MGKLGLGVSGDIGLNLVPVPRIVSDLFTMGTDGDDATQGLDLFQGEAKRFDGLLTLCLGLFSLGNIDHNGQKICHTLTLDDLTRKEAIMNRPILCLYFRIHISNLAIFEEHFGRSVHILLSYKEPQFGTRLAQNLIPGKAKVLQKSLIDIDQNPIRRTTHNHRGRIHSKKPVKLLQRLLLLTQILGDAKNTRNTIPRTRPCTCLHGNEATTLTDQGQGAYRPFIP